MKVKEKKKAVELRKSGYSLAEISRKLSISKATASVWLKKTQITTTGSERLQKRIVDSRLKGSRILRKRKVNRLALAEKEAEHLLDKIPADKNLALSVLAMIYWCEGAKMNVHISFTNSDPNLISLFLRMFRKCFIVNESSMCSSP